MIRIIDRPPKLVCEITKPMYQMKPLEECIVVSGTSYKDRVVMRTADKDHFEVMDLTDPRPDACWVNIPTVIVRELYFGEIYTFELTGK